MISGLTFGTIFFRLEVASKRNCFVCISKCWTMFAQWPPIHFVRHVKYTTRKVSLICIAHCKRIHFLAFGACSLFCGYFVFVSQFYGSFHLFFAIQRISLHLSLSCLFLFFFFFCSNWKIRIKFRVNRKPTVTFVCATEIARQMVLIQNLE